MHVKARKQMPSQFSALRLTVAAQMAGYEERIAQRIRTEAGKRGESPVDLASALGASASTTERWFRAERIPQRRYRKELTDRWNLPPDFFEPDLEAEEREVRDQLNRIEQKLDRVLTILEGQAVEEGEAGLDALDEDQGHPRDEASGA